MYALRGNMRRGGQQAASGSAPMPNHPPQAMAAPPEPSPYPKCAADLCTKILRLIKANKDFSKASKTPQFIELQQQIDNDIFCLSCDQFHISKLTPLQKLSLLQLLGESFKDKVDDQHRQAFFDVLFLGREDEPVLHEQRVSVLFNFVSYALQQPITNIFAPLMHWFKRKTTPEMYSERLMALLTEHFISDHYNKMYEFLYPLSLKCPEFAVLFLTISHRTVRFGVPLAAVIGHYLQSQSQIFRTFKEERWMAREFARRVFPKSLFYILTAKDNTEWNKQERDAQKEAASSLCAGIIKTIENWKENISDHYFKLDLGKEQDKELKLDKGPIFDARCEWTGIRVDFLKYYARKSEENYNKIREFLEEVNPPKWVKVDFDKCFADHPLEEGEIE